jgi:drug/metabolite transporter (DMT)-like permease
MLWQVLLGISIITYSVSMILQRMLIKNNKDPMAFAILFQFCTAILIGIVAVVMGFQIPNIIPLLPNFILTIVIYTLANICLFQSLSRIEASQFTILFVTRGIWTILTATIFLHESFSLIRIIGTGFILLSVFFVSYSKKGFVFNTGSLYALGAGFLFGIGYVNDAYIVKFFSSPITYSFLDFLLPAIVLWGLYYRSVRRQIKMLTKPVTLLKLSILCVIYSVFGITILLSYKYGGEASVIGAVSQSTTVVIVLLAIVFLGEKNQLLKKIVSSLLAFIGVLFLG